MALTTLTKIGKGITSFFKAKGATHARELDERFSDELTVKDFGAKGDGESDDTLAIQSMLDELGHFVLTTGVFVISDTLLIPNKRAGTVFKGNGMEQSTIRCVNMEGKNAIEPMYKQNYVRMVMRDFAVDGDCDSCFYFDSALELYLTRFENLMLKSKSRASLYIFNHFSTSFANVQCWSEQGHCFEIEGGNSTVMNNCYAHMVGEGKAGYRLGGGATLIGCNGIDEINNDSYWGWFGTNPSIAVRVTMIGCNCEDFGQSGALKFENFGYLTIQTTSFLARSSGTYETIIRTDNSSQTHITIDTGTTVVTKGATFNGHSYILGRNIHMFDNTGNFTDYYDPTSSRLVSTPFRVIEQGVYNRQAVFIENLKSNMLPNLKTAEPLNSGVIDVKGNLYKTANTSIVYLAQTTGSFVDGYRLTIMIGDGFTNMVHGIGGRRFKLSSGATEQPMAGSVYEFIYSGDQWVQVGGSFTQR